ncbi:MAG: InlB B-repeat-containing protein [Bacteroidales bacterium]|nr:InlB B-repeat-containing protein [Bacteroidales bacterium]
MKYGWSHSIFLIAVIFLIAAPGCMERVDVDLSPSEYMTFRATLGDSSQVRTRSIADNFEITEEEWPLEVTADGEHTKATLNNILGNYSSAGVFGYYGKDDICTILKNSQFKFDGDEMVTEHPPRWSSIKQDNNESITIYAYAPRIETLASNVIPIADVSDSQIDYIAAASDPIALNSSTNTYQSIQLPFEHIYAAIQLKAGFDCTISSISISNVIKGGTYTIGSGWESGAENITYSLSNLSLAVKAGDNIGEPILMIPQVLTGSVLTIETTDGTYSVSLDKKEWRQGKLITYTLNKKQSDDAGYIYFDIAAGNVTIEGNSYSGKVFVAVAGDTVAQVISGVHESGNKYYIYQSCVTEVNKNKGNFKVGYPGYDNKNKKGTGKLTLPTYPEVMYDETTRWRDFITNNSNVESVIEAWDNSTGANSNSSIDNTKAVRKAGRESTQNTIMISGKVGVCYMTIDNIYISKQESQGNRKSSSISFIPEDKTGSILTLNIVGDNRVGAVHYDNNTKAESEEKQNKLVFEGAGSITAADTDFRTGKYNAGGSITGYYSNHFDSAIGNADTDGYENCYGIVINSGVIYAGTTKAENSTAIGGGGNGYGEVVINGGVVTAVASTTGTAIGGGIGFNAAGGVGYVEINGGNVYAYNNENAYGIPSSAIGGAGSKSKSGSLGTVIVNDGYVYAYSALGTAIGGGSSQTNKGGDADVTITGGNVIAKSGAAGSAGIGGGMTCTGGGSSLTGNNRNGGNATIIIGSKNSVMPILRTGSIGGGGTNASGGNIGNANITIYGGDIQAQFVMAASPNNVFNMQGGLIRNSDTSDDGYKCIQENGGAVYMQQGTFTMSGGTIKKCSASKTSASKGGAVYIEGGSFTMSGGTIELCTSNSDGGALYIEGGSVLLSGNVEFSGNVSKNGNGGAICINGGTFEMNGENVNISNNAAIDREHLGIGNGGGVYVSSASGTMTVGLTKGSITGNAAGRNGGGVCVINKGEGLTVNISNIINNNNSLLEGGGLYVRGANANVNINDGSVKNNTTSGYQKNQQIKVEGEGLVTLNKAGVTDQITVTFNDNASYYGKTIEGNVATDTETYQYLVRSNRGILSDVTPTKEGYTFSEWNTRRDGKGVTYTNTGVEVILDQDITLYAIWNKN